MSAPGSEIICYDGRTLTVSVRPLVQVEARRGRRWGWFGTKGWWIHLSLLHGWRVKKFVLTLSEAGVFLKHDPDYLPWIEEEQNCVISSDAEPVPSGPVKWTSEAPF